MGAETVDLTVDKQTFKGFDEKIKNKGELFVQEMNNAENADKKGEIKEKVAAFDRNSGIMLRLILSDISNGTKFATIDATNAKEPKLQTYKDAKIAFEKDMKALNITNSEITTLLGDIQNIIDLKSIEANPAYVNDFDKKKTTELLALATLPATQKILTERLRSLESKETDVLNSLLNAAPSREIANNLFEKNQTARNALLMKNRKQTDTDKTQEQRNFEKLLKFYGKTDQEVESYEVKNYDKNNQENPKSNYIQVKFKEIPGVTANTATGEKEVEGVKERTEDIMFGASTDIVHRTRAEAFKDENKREESNDIKTNLKALDDKGSYAAFENIVKSKGAESSRFLSGLLGKNLLEELSDNKFEKEGEAKINRYYGVILDYIVSTKNEGLLNIYLNHVVVSNIINTKYLGTNQKTQIENFNKIVDKSKWTINKTSDNGKKLETIRLDLASGITKDMKETIKGSIDDFFKAYGDVIVGILERFGGKGAARKFFIGTLGMSEEKFGEYFKELDKIYKEKYGLSDPQKKILNDELYDKYNPTEEKDDLPIGGGKVIHYNKETVIGLAKTAFTGNNFQYLDPDLVEKAGTEEKIENIIIKEEKDGKIVKKINNDITPENKNKIIQQILNGDKTTSTGSEKLWKDVAVSANTIMETTRIYGNIEKPANNGQNERNNAQNQNRIDKGIKKGADIALFVGAYMMKGGENLAYTITETDGLKNKDSEVQETVINPEVNRKLAFNGEGTLVKAGVVTDTGAKKAIHDIVDMKNAPQKLQIIRGTTTIDIEQKPIDGTLTYVAVNDRTKTVAIKTGDEIKEVPAEKPIADKRTEVKTELDKAATKAAKKAFELPTYTLDNKNIYQTQIAKISNLFTGDYNKLISETNQTTLKSLIKDNALDFKNMFTYRSLKQNDKNNTDTNYTSDKLDLTAATALTSKTDTTIDLTKQNFTLKEDATNNKISISVTRNSTDVSNTAKEGSITLVTDDKGKLTTIRTETGPAVAQAK